MLDNASLGFLGLTFCNRKDYTTAEFEFFQALAQQATLAIQLTRLAEAAKQAAITKEQEKAAQERAAQLARANQVLQRTVAQLVGQDDLNQFITYVLLEAARETEAANAAIFLYDSQSDTLKMHYAVQDGQVVNLDTDSRFTLWKTPVPADISPAWKKITQSFVIWLDINQSQVDGWDFSISWHLQMGHQSVLCVPLLLGHEPLGFLGLCFRDPIRHGVEPIELVQTLAHQATLALQLTRLAEEAKQAVIAREQEKAAQLQVTELAKANDVLKNTLDTLATEPELDCFLRHILSVIAQQMNASACLLWLFDESLQTATLHLSYTDGQVNLPARFNADRTQPLCLHSQSWVFRTDQRQPYLVEVANPPFSRASCVYLTRSGVKAILIVPLWLGDQLIGSFGVRLPEVRDFAPNELELVQALSHQATLALQLMQLTEQASHSAVLEERNRMAREIHDVLAQAFTGVVVQLEAAKMITPQDAPLQPLLAQAQDLARAGLVEARRSVWSLRPQALENTNLRSALEQLVQTLAHNTSVQIQLRIQGVDCAIVPEVETQLLRIAQEALTNALTHAQASTIQIELTFGTQAVELCVRDDGQGFEPTAVRGHGFGLVSMQERADCINGEFTLTSQPSCGTIVLIAAPLSPQSKVPTRRS
jgi:signal transduction histidine kinase